MALPAIIVTDFQGLVDVTQDTYTTTDFQSAINELIKDFVRDLVGNPAFTQISSQDLERWDFFFAGGTYTNASGQLVTLPSVRAILVKLIYAQWVSIQPMQNTPVGSVFNQNENASRLSGGDIGAKAAKQMASASSRWDQVREFIDEYRQQKAVIDTVSAVSATIFDFTFATTPPYLEEGDTADINGEYFTVDTITLGVYRVSFAAAPAVAPIAGSEVIYSPFDIVTSPTPEILVGSW
jgi:hypothetical protein